MHKLLGIRNSSGHLCVATLVVCIYPCIAASENPEWVYEHASRSVVTVVASNMAAQSKLSIGSGVVVDTEKVATNCHVIEGFTVLMVIQGQQSFRAAPQSRHSFADLCLLRVPTLPFPPISQLKSLSKVKVGQRVYAIGSPLGLELTLSDGLISGIREMPVKQKRPSGNTQSVVQSTAAIERGSSGGGLFDESGALVGITTFGSPSGNQNFAIPADRVSELLQQATPTSAAQPRTQQVEGSPARSVADQASPNGRSAFETEEAGQHWLALMSERLQHKMPDSVAREDFLKTLAYEADRAGLDMQMVLSVIDVVSNFNKYAVSKYGKRGYMQVPPYWLSLIGDSGHNLFNTRTNLRYGCTILRHFLNQTNGDVYLALGRYYADGLSGSGMTIEEGRFQNDVLRAGNATWNLSKNVDR